jgi:DNA-cytosine methyltransferase
VRILSLFDGISVGRLALKNAGIKIDKYYASEIDPYAIKVAQSNFKSTIQLGDVMRLNESNLPSDIDVLFAGFPCQSYSLLGKQAGLDSEMGRLVYELIRIRNIIKPTFFLFENVWMRSTNQTELNELFGCDAFNLDSCHFSAQTRKRLYWTNLEVNLNNLSLNKMCFNDIRDHSDFRNLIGGDNVRPGMEKVYLPFPSGNPPAHTRTGLYQLGAIQKRSNGMRLKPKNRIRIEDRVYSEFGKYPCLTASSLGSPVLLDGGNAIRRPNSIERERLQGLKDNYTLVARSEYRRRLLIGNSWNVPTIEFLLKSLC